MKKLYFVLIGILLMLTGCSSDEEYINTVKKITFPDGVTVEKWWTTMSKLEKLIL